MVLEGRKAGRKRKELFKGLVDAVCDVCQNACCMTGNGVLCFERGGVDGKEGGFYDWGGRPVEARIAALFLKVSDGGSEQVWGCPA